MGEIIAVHPKLVRRENYEEEIASTMEKWPAPPTDITKFWNEENNINKEKETATAPKHKLMVGERMYRNGGGKVEATTFKVICKDKDGLYLKSLMSATWQHKDNATNE